MKVMSLALTGLILIFLTTSAVGQDKPPPRGNKTSSKPPGQDMRQTHFPRRPIDPMSSGKSNEAVVFSAGGPRPPAADTGVGICLIGDQYELFTDPVEAEKCDAVMWVDAMTWLINQRKLIDQSTLMGDSSTSEDGTTLCRSCSGTCQVVALPIEDSTYEDVEVDGGQRPGECVTAIKAMCESGSFRHFANARCGN